MNKFLARIVLISAPDVSIADRLKYGWDWFIHLAPIAFCLQLVNWWFTENSQFGTFMCMALIMNLIVGMYTHYRRGTFNFKDFLWKNGEMAIVVIVTYVMLEMLRYTAGDNIAGEIFRITIQIITLLYPTSKVLKNVYIISDGKYPPEFLMTRLYNFEKNGDLSVFFGKKEEK